MYCGYTSFLIRLLTLSPQIFLPPQPALGFLKPSHSAQCQGQQFLQRYRLGVAPDPPLRHMGSARHVTAEPKLCCGDYFRFPYVAVKTHVGLFPSIFNRKILGSVISFVFFFPFINYSVTNRANCSLQRCIVHDISVNVLFSGEKFTTRQPEVFKTGKLPNLYHFTFLC